MDDLVDYYMVLRVCALHGRGNVRVYIHLVIIVYRFERARAAAAMWSSLPQTFMGVVKPQFSDPEGL